MNAIINPYANIDWSQIQKIVSISHAHSRVRKNDGTKGDVYQTYLDNTVNDGCVHIPFSNYYPSEPFYPLTNWFEEVPEGIISSPNAEHHNFTGWPNLHINGLGCTYVSGNPGGTNPVGINTTVENGVRLILNTLQYSDGGGLTINHPGWTTEKNAEVGNIGYLPSNKFEKTMYLLNLDERVLGIEIVSEITGYLMGITQKNYEEGSPALWDQILLTGKRCWGFCVPDHETEYGRHWCGRNILLVDELDEHKCLKAYRNGTFFSRIFDSNLEYDLISYQNDTFSVSAPGADAIKIIIDGETTSVSGDNASVSIPNGSTYVRAEAWMDYVWTDRNGTQHNVIEKAYTNPVIFKQYVKPSNNGNDFEKFVVMIN